MAWRWILILLVVWIGFECAISWAAFCQPHYEQAAANQNYPEYCAFRGPLLGIIAWIWTGAVIILHDRDKEIVAAFTIILAFSTIFLWVSTRDAARAGAQAAEIAERALIAGQRAFVSVSFAQNANRNIGTGNVMAWIFKPIWTNAGDTPTRDMVNHINIRTFDGPIPKDWGFPDLWHTNVPADERVSVPMGIAPKSILEGQSVSVTVETMDEVVAGDKQLFIWGWAEYNDVFPDTPKHITRFAVRIVAGGNPRDSSRMSFSYPYLVRYNCSDEECKHQGYPAGWRPQEMITDSVDGPLRPI